MKSYYQILIATIGICFSTQTLALRVVGGKTSKSESNYFSSIARIQSGASGSPEIALLGSSITGRLPDRSNGFKGFANMGCDGGCAADALRAMDKGLLPTAPLIIIEGNSLILGARPGETEIARAIRSSWFAVGKKITAVSATARPSAFLYSRLLAGKIGGAGSPAGNDEGVTTQLAGLKEEVALPTLEERELVKELAAIIARLARHGTQCWVVMLPPKIRPHSPQHDLACALAIEAKVPFWDLAAGIGEDKIRLTDGVHMAPESAALTMRALARKIKEAR